MIADSTRPSGLDDLTDSQLRRIDQICDGVETAWSSERRPGIEALLDADGGPHRRLLLQELVLAASLFPSRPCFGPPVVTSPAGRGTLVRAIPLPLAVAGPPRRSCRQLGRL
jgi:hypothetical protein